MTTRIYIRGNVGQRGSLRVFDDDTGTELCDVAKITIVAMAGVVQAELVRLNNPNTVAHVVPGPPHPDAGKVAYQVTIDADKRHPTCDTVHRAKVQERTVGDDGRLQPKGQTVSVHNAVSDQDVARAINPRDVLERSADRALSATIRQAITAPLLVKLLGPRTGGVVSSKPSPFNHTPYPGGKPAKKDPRPTCDECFGTGLTGGFMHPCSKGCTP
jgi:hypothetical protein